MLSRSRRHSLSPSLSPSLSLLLLSLRLQSLISRVSACLIPSSLAPLSLLLPRLLSLSRCLALSLPRSQAANANPNVNRRCRRDTRLPSPPSRQPSLSSDAVRVDLVMRVLRCLPLASVSSSSSTS